MPMETSITKQLVELNRIFYADFASAFSATRQRLQPGVKRVIQEISPQAKILDLGCGNGELPGELFEKGHKGSYVGLDFSQELLEIARSRSKMEAGIKAPSSIFFLTDLTQPGWHKALPENLIPFDYVLGFAVLHHIPGYNTRLEIIKNVNTLLSLGGKFIHSEWQFLNSTRMRKRIVAWSEADIDPAELEKGDTLLDWRREGHGLRYVHHFQADELSQLADEGGFCIQETFESDGEGGRLGLYQIWEKALPGS